MAYIELYKDKLKHNYQFLNSLFKQHNKEWGIVTKLLCGNKKFIQEIVHLGVKELIDSRISNLQVIKELDPSIKTVYIKPPAKRSIPNIIKYADVSFNTEYDTIKLLSEEANKQGKIHEIVIMIELGDLREGVMGEDLIGFYGEVFQLKGIKVTGIGANLNCLSGVLPSQDKLIQLSLYKQLIEATFKRKIPWVTGGTSIFLPLLKRKQVPSGINHFRIGEALFFGNDLLTNEPYKGMRQDVIKLFAEIIEITKKPKVPIGFLSENPSEEIIEVKEGDYSITTTRAIIDIGLLDITADFLIPEDDEISIIGASSDMLILDLNNCKKHAYNIGDVIPFKLKYMGALRLFNSDYVEKRVV
jgi:predicted amino acid racemase